MVARRQIRIVVDRDRVLAEPARRLDHQDDVVRLHCGDHDLAVGVADCDRRTTRRAAAPSARRPRRRVRLGRVREPVAIVLGRQPDRVAAQLPFGEPVGVLAAALDQRVDQGVPVAGVDARARRRPGSRRRASPAAARPRWPGCRARPRCRCGRAWWDRPRTPGHPLVGGGDRAAAARAARPAPRRVHNVPDRRRRRSAPRRRSP